VLNRHVIAMRAAVAVSATCSAIANLSHNLVEVAQHQDLVDLLDPIRARCASEVSIKDDVLALFSQPRRRVELGFRVGARSRSPPMDVVPPPALSPVARWPVRSR